MNYNIEKLLLELNKDSKEIYRKMLYSENYFRKNEDMIEPYINNAIKVSKNRFSNLVKNYGALNINQYLKIFGIEVIEVEEENPFSYPYLAIFDSEKKTIEMNIKLVNHIKNNITRFGLTHDLNENFTCVILTHELFHYLDELDKKFDNKEFSITIKLFNIVEKKKTLEILKEIAAMEFSKVLNGIEYNPIIYEYLI